jgi:hypothetical protein
MMTVQPEPVATLGIDIGGIDIGKNCFHVIGLTARGTIVLHQKLSRGQVEQRLANMPACLIGMETCVGAHHLSRRLLALGHQATMPALKMGQLCFGRLPRPKRRPREHLIQESGCLIAAAQQNRPSRTPPP